MGQAPTVSVICTCYNKGKWIRQAIESVIAQKTSFPFELIVADDASTDNSLVVIEELLGKYTDIMRVIAHEQNLGISQTWVEACEVARGDYIARIDGDDYWTSESKLEVQVEALRNAEDSQWCCTDFDMVDMDGTVAVANALASRTVPPIDSYEHMLAVKGITCSSTWLLDAQIIREANRSLHEHDADDTFSLQLELFQSTQLTRIDQSMCAMRVNWGSDSRPPSLEGARKRFEGLRDQQLEYLNKFTDADYQKLARYLIVQDAEKDLAVFERDRRIENLMRQVEELSASQGSTLTNAARSIVHRLSRGK